MVLADVGLQAGGNFAKVIFSGDLSGNLNGAADKVLERVFTILQYEAPQLEAKMKIEAPWTDRTSNARNGLAARAYRDGDNLGIVLYHQVPYGVFLELRFNGKYGIILPTIETEGPRVLESAQNVMTRMRF